MLFGADHAVVNLVETVHKAIEEQSITEMVVATNGRVGLEKMIAGSVTEGLLKRIKVPTLVCKVAEETDEE